MNRIFFALLALPLLLLTASCTSTPREVPPSGEPDVGLPVRRPAAYTAETLPEPSVKLVDLRRLRVGMTMDEVLAIFPGPEERKISPRDTIVWQYQFAELYFRDGRLHNWFDLEREY